jgi:hypothetical protein
MSGRSEWLANLLVGALFLTSACLILPIILFRHVSAILAAWPGGPLA